MNHLVLRHILLVTGYILRHQQHVISVMEQHLRVESSEKMKIARKQLEAAVIMLRKDLEVQQRQSENIEKFVQKAHKYVGIEELDPYALRELVKAIYVDAPVKVNGKCTQYIHIQYDGIGFIPLDELLKGETA